MSNLRDLWYDWLGINTWLFKQINSLSDIPVYTHIMKFVTIFGDKDLLPYYVGFIAAYAIISSIASHGNTRHQFLVWFNILVVMIGSLAVSQYVGDYMKTYFSFPRPYVTLPAGEIFVLEAQRPEAANRSFPSGHAATITILIVALWPILIESIRWAGIMLIGLVCWSRIALGVHYPMDVISGFTLAFLAVTTIRFILFRIYAMINGLMNMLSSAR